MDAEDTPPGGDPISGEEVRRATFPQALRGYDRQAVHDLLDRVADWMEGTAGAISGSAPDMREEIAKVGERTTGILTAAEDAARKLRDEATEYAERLRADAEDETRKARLNASQKMDEMIGEAEEKAKTIIDDAIARRRQLNVAISSLVDRRDEIAADATRLAEELLAAVEDLRRPDAPGEDVAQDFPPAEPAHGEPPSEEVSLADAAEEPPSQEEPVEELALEEEETVIHPGPDSEEADVAEDDNPEARRTPTLLVDPDEED